VDTVNIMAYDEGAYGGKPFRLDFATILDNFAKYGKIPPSKINMGFEPSIHQAAHGTWEGEAVDESAAKEIVKKKTAGGVALWAVNPTPSATNNASVLCKNAAEALHNIVKPKYAYGNPPNFTKCTGAGWFPSGPVNNTCGESAERVNMMLSCPGKTISKINFAHYGTPTGNCQVGFQPKPSCDVDVTAIVEKACAGKEYCVVGCTGALCSGTNVSDPCSGTVKRLAASVSCSGSSEVFIV